MYYPYSENKGADQLCSYCIADLRLFFAQAKIQFSRNVAHIVLFCFKIYFYAHVGVKFNLIIMPHFYIAKLGYAGVFLLFLFLLQKIDCGYSLELPREAVEIDCGYSLELPRRGCSNVYPQSMF